MIDDSTAVFPNNVVELIALRVKTLDPDLQVFRRPLKNTDPTQSVGISGSQWNPDDTSFEFPSMEPTLQRYEIRVEAFVLDYDEEKGLATHSVLSKMIRALLYRDEPLRVGFAALEVSMNGSLEKARRWGIANQRYYSNEITGSFLYLSVISFWIETETR